MTGIVIPDGGTIGSTSDTDAISIASSGKPTFSQGIANTGTIDAGTIGSNVAFPDGMIVDRQYYKYTFSSNNYYDVSSATNTIITRTSGSDATVQSITIEPGHTYIYEFQIYQELFRDNNTVGNRFFGCRICEGTTDRSQGHTNTDTLLANGINGRELASGSSATAPSYGLRQYKGAIYYGSGEATTRYVYLAANSNDSDKTLRQHFSTSYPCYLFITKIKGSTANDVT